MSSDTTETLIGVVIGGKFRVTKEIGRGGMAAIYSAQNIDIGKAVAVKLLAPELATSKTITERFLREARAAAKIRSPFICEVYDVGTYEGRPFIVMELLNGESLYERLARERQLSADETLRIASGAARGLKKAHAAGIVHRDLKPENIFLTFSDDGSPLTKVVDFGLAKFYEPTVDNENARLTKEGALFGTPAYMSPEQAKAKGNVDHRSDLWALGCIVYEMLTGRTVWDVEQGVAMILAQIATHRIPEPRKHRPDLPVTFDAWFKKALARKVDARFQSAAEFVTALERGLAPAVTEAAAALRPAPTPVTVETATVDSETSDPETPVSQGREHSKRKAHFIFGGALALLVVGVGSWVAAGALSRGYIGDLPSPVETAPFAANIAKAQELLIDGETEKSRVKLQEAFDQGQGKAARSLLTHLSATIDNRGGDCQLSAIGHPRPFHHKSESTRPSIHDTGNGILVTWADNESDTDRHQAHTTLLDYALRRVRPIVNVTPEGRLVREPLLFARNEAFGLLYWDFGAGNPGTFVRKLDAAGSISGPPQLLSGQTQGHPYYPTLTQDGEGNVWVVWVEPSRERVHDLVIRKLSSRLEPISEAIAVTGYATPRHGKVHAARPSIEAHGGVLYISYTLRRPRSQHVLLLKLSPAQAVAGPSALPSQQTVAANDEESDRFLGQVIQVSSGAGKHGLSTLKCATQGCFLAWDSFGSVDSGAKVTQLTTDGRVEATRTVAPEGARPGLATDGQQQLVAWYENKHVRGATLTTDGARGPSVLGRVSAILKHPQPLIIPAQRQQAQWYVAWRAYEAGATEPFIARIDCESP